MTTAIVIVRSSRPGFWRLGRQWTGDTACEVREFEGPRPEPDAKSPATYVLSPGEAEAMERRTGTPITLHEFQESQRSEAEAAKRASSLDGAVADAQRRLAAIEEMIGKRREELTAVDARVTTSNKELNSLGKKLKRAEQRLAKLDSQARGGGGK